MSGTTQPARLEDAALSGVTGGNFTDRHGTAGDDTITTGEGMDKIFAGAGDDRIASGGNTDEVHAGAGQDAADLGAGDDKAFGGAGDDAFYWAPGDGNDEFHGDGGTDTLILPTMGLDELNAALKLNDSNLEMAVKSTGEVTFHDKLTGEARSFSGEITVGGETLKFFNVEKMQIKF